MHELKKSRLIKDSAKIFEMADEKTIEYVIDRTEKSL